MPKAQFVFISTDLNDSKLHYFHTREECKNWVRREIIEKKFFSQPALMDTKDYEDEDGRLYRNVYAYTDYTNGGFIILGRLYYREPIGTLYKNGKFLAYGQMAAKE